MLYLAECLVISLLFTLIVMLSVKKDPLKWVDDYPPAIAARIRELGLVKDSSISFKQLLITKLIKLPAIGLVLALIVRYVNGAESFLDGFLLSYGIWFFIAWWDALVIDCIWVCHDRSIRVKGTEDMKEWKDYAFHIRMSGIGTLLGIPAALLAGLFTALLALF